MSILVSGSIAYDNIMGYSGVFKDYLLEKKKEHLSVAFEVDSYKIFYGGTSANISYNLKLLGINPVIAANAGYDFENYKKYLNKLKINTKYISISSQKPTASASIITDKRESQITFFYPGAMNNKRIWTYPSNITLAIISPEAKTNMMQTAIECRKRKIDYIFDPGQSLPVWKRKEFVKMINNAYSLVCNSYEWEIIISKFKIQKPKLLKKLKFIIITKGKKGSTIYTGNKIYRIQAVRTDRVLDPTGAGDAYRAGIIFGILKKYSLKKTGKIASLIASYCIGKKGTQRHKFSLAQLGKEYKNVFNENF